MYDIGGGLLQLQSILQSMQSYAQQQYYTTTAAVPILTFKQSLEKEIKEWCGGILE